MTMKTEKAKGYKMPEMPFQVDRKLRVDIAKQVTDGIRQAFLSGFYKPGDQRDAVRDALLHRLRAA